jgi:hypothetical protein
MGQDALSYDRSLEIPSYTNLLSYARHETLRVRPTHKYEILVYRMNSIIWKTRLVDWSRNGLNDGIRLINLKFKEVPNNLRFVVRVWRIYNGRGSQTESTINSQLSVSYSSLSSAKKKDKKGYRLRAQIKSPQSFGAISQSSYRSWSPLNGNGGGSYGGSGQRMKSSYSRDLANNVGYVRTTVTSIGSSTSTGEKRIIRQVVSSVRTPNYKALARLKRLPVNPFSFYRADVDRGTFAWNRTYTDGSFSNQSWTADLYLNTADVPAFHLPVDENIVVSRLRSKINGTTANIAESVATANQTLGLFTGNVRILTSAARALRTGNFGAYNRILRDPNPSWQTAFKAAKRGGMSVSQLLANYWLQYRYGWLPLLNDSKALIEQFARYVAEDPVLTQSTASATKSSESLIAVTGLGDVAPTQPAGYTDIRTRTKVKIGIRYKIDNRVLNTFSSLGLTSPVSLAWELVPFSFLFDWFLPVGNALESFSAFEGLAFHSGYNTKFTKQVAVQNFGTSKTRAPSFPGAGDGLTERFEGGCYGIGVRCTRTVLTNFPSATIPRFKNPISAIHAANAVALLVRALR